jgi:hypothetical protein
MAWAKGDIGWIGWNEALVPSAARTTSGNSGVIEGYGPATALRLQLNVTAASGTTPTLNVIVEDTFDGTTFNTVGTFAQKTAVSREVINITTPFTDRLRVTWTIAGTTPSFTFTVDCNATATTAGG